MKTVVSEATMIRLHKVVSLAQKKICHKSFRS